MHPIITGDIFANQKFNRAAVNEWRVEAFHKPKTTALFMDSSSAINAPPGPKSIGCYITHAHKLSD